MEFTEFKIGQKVVTIYGETLAVTYQNGIMVTLSDNREYHHTKIWAK